MTRRPAAIACLIVLVAACDGRTVGVTPPCPELHTRVGRACIPTFDACPREQVPMLGGGCRVIGIPKGTCAKGFVEDVLLGCKPVLPMNDCVPGYMGIPGDALCHAVSRCPTTTGKWDGIPTDGERLYVDASAVGAPDGTQEHPYLAIADALRVAKVGITIALAPGVYAGQLRIERAVKLWGRCAEEVTVAGTAPGTTVLVEAPVELHNLAVKGGDQAVAAKTFNGSLSLDGVWVYDAQHVALFVEVSNTVAVRDSLIERSPSSIVISRGTVVVSRSVIRQTSGRLDGEGRGIVASGGAATTLTVEQSLIEDMEVAGIDLTASAVVRGTVFRPSQRAGYTGASILVGAGVQLDLVDSFLEANEAGAVATTGDGPDTNPLPAKLRIERTVVAGVPASSSAMVARAAIHVEDGDLEILDSLFHGVAYGAVDLRRAIATIDRTLVRDTQPNADGFGFGARADYAAGASTLTLTSSAIVGSKRAGIIVRGSRATLTGVLVTGTARDPKTRTEGDAVLLRAIHEKEFSAPAEATVQSSTLAENEGAAIASVGGSVKVSSSRLLCNAASFVEETLVTKAAIDTTASQCGCGAIEGCPP